MYFFLQYHVQCTVEGIAVKSPPLPSPPLPSHAVLQFECPSKREVLKETYKKTKKHTKTKKALASENSTVSKTSIVMFGAVV